MAMNHSAIAGFAGVLLLAGSAQAQPSQAPGGNVAHGHQLFLADGCFECHGTVGQGATTAPRLAPNPLPAAAIISYIRNPTGQMPPYSDKVLSDAEIGDIHAYLASIRKPAVKWPGE